MIDAIDAILLRILPVLAWWILLNGLDDLFLDLTCLLRRRKLPRMPSLAALRDAPEKRIAIFVPCWREDKVIEKMIAHNIRHIDYRRYHFFVGAYANDAPTLAAVQRLEARWPNVHLSVCGNSGPTSKADCLNWIYRRMTEFERQRGLWFDLVVTHDAEDVIHPRALRWLNWHADRYDMVQVPVLPLATGPGELTHGLYCDDFAEYANRDSVVRQMLGGFLPSNGVGTGYTRHALDLLAAHNGAFLFDPACLTEDYDNGLLLQRLGCRQHFIPLHFEKGAPMATREYFPKRFRAAVKQRTRWVTGIALQSWERHGWRGGFRQAYWFWRDRKGLIGNPASALATLAFCFGALTWLATFATGREWGLADAQLSGIPRELLAANFGLQVIRQAYRARCAAVIYGWPFALGVPLRSIWGNAINLLATTSAIRRYFWARLRGQPLVWLKTDHAYPAFAKTPAPRLLLEEILVSHGWVPADRMASAIDSKPPGSRLGDWLVSQGLLSHEELVHAIATQHGLPVARFTSAALDLRVVRALPAQVARHWRVVPFRIAKGRLHVAVTDPPPGDAYEELQQFTRLTIRFHLTTKAQFSELAAHLWTPAEPVKERAMAAHA